MIDHKKIILTVESLLLLLLAGVFVYFVTADYKSPGLIPQGYYDQCGAEHLVKVLKRQPFSEVFKAGKLVKSHGYHGELFSYLMVLPLYWFGFKWYVVKLFYFSFGVISLCAFYLLLRDNTSRPIAILAAAMLVFHVSYLAGIRLGPKYVTPMHFFTIMPLLMFNRWLWTRRPRYCYLTALFLGLGLCTRLCYLWYLNAFVIAAASCFDRVRDVWRAYDRRTKMMLAVISACCFMAGASLIIYRDLSGDFKSLRVLSGRAHRPMVAESVSESSYLMRMNTVLHTYGGMLSGDILSRTLLGDKSFEQRNKWFPWAFWSCWLLCVPFLFSTNRRDFFLRQVWILFTVIFVQMGLFRNYVPDLHVFVIYPFPQAIMAVGIGSLYGVLNRSRWKIAIALAVACLVMSEARSAVIFSGRFRQEVRKGLRADIIYSMADDMMKKRSEGKQLVFLEWASRISFYYIHPELKESTAIDDRTDYTKTFASMDLDEIYIVSQTAGKAVDRGGTVGYQIGGRFEEWVHNRGRVLTVVKEYKTPQGETVYAAWEMPLRKQDIRRP